MDQIAAYPVRPLPRDPATARAPQLSLFWRACPAWRRATGPADVPHYVPKERPVASNGLRRLPTVAANLESSLGAGPSP